MALPNPSANIPQNAPPMNAKDPVVDEIKDVKLTLKEAVTTGLKAGFLTTQTKVFSKIPLFGRGLAERAEFKKREMFEREGRDPLTGRKLTKEELEEKQLRKKSMGAMGDIRDDVAEIRDILINQFGASAAGAKPSSPPALIVASSDKTTPYALEGEEPVMDKLSAEEAMQEKQKADREVQEEMQEKEQTFFEKLFKKYFGEGNKRNATAVAASGGGLLSKIAGIVDFAADIKSLGGGSVLRGIGRKIPGVRNIPGVRTPTPPPLPTSPPPLPGVKTSPLPTSPPPLPGVKPSPLPTSPPPLSGVKPSPLPTPSAAPSGGGFFSRAFSAVKNVGKKVAKMGLSTVGKTVLGILGPLLTVALGSFNISDIKNDPNLSLAEKKRQIGLTIGRMIGSLLGAGVAALGLGPAGPILTSILDGFGIGPGALGEWLTEKIGPEKVYDLTAAIPGIGSLIKVPEDEGKPVNGAEGEMSPEGELSPETVGDPFTVPDGMTPEDAYKNLGMNTTGLTPTEVATAIPSVTPSSASTLGNLQTENSMLKSAPTVQPIVAPTNNNVVTTNNNTSWMSPLTTTRTGADFDERSFRLGLAF